LSASQQGARIVAQFTLPSHTTESLDITKTGPDRTCGWARRYPSQTEVWEAAAKLLEDVNRSSGGEVLAPAREWIGRDVVIGVKIFSENGRTAGWSNLVTLSVVEPLAQPGDLQVKAVADGVQSLHGTVHRPL
jgi:hypothetical protein